jgi:hypothetical protein
MGSILLFAPLEADPRAAGVAVAAIVAGALLCAARLRKRKP